MDDKDLDDCFPDEMINQIVDGMGLDMDIKGDENAMLIEMMESDPATLREAVFGPGEPNPNNQINLEDATTLIAHCSLAGQLLPRDMAGAEKALRDNWPTDAETVSED